MEVERSPGQTRNGDDTDDTREEVIERRVERNEEEKGKEQGEDECQKEVTKKQEYNVISINSNVNSFTCSSLQPLTSMKQFTIPKLNIEGESDHCITSKKKLVNRKVQICLTEEKHILSFYWTKMAKRGDRVLLVRVIRESTSETEAKKEEEKSLGLVSEFKKGCEQQGIVCEQIFPIGNPEEVICEVADQLKPHLVVLGSKMTKKHSSVSRHVLRNSSSPVLLVPIVRGHLRRGFTSVAAVAQAAIRFGMNSETIL